MNCFRVLTVLLLLASTSFCQTASSSGSQASSNAPDLTQYGLEAVDFEGAHSFSQKQLIDAFNIPVGKKFNPIAAGQGLERLRQLYGDYGYINFTAVPMLQLDNARGTVIVTISIDEGSQFSFGRLSFEGQEPKAGEAETLRSAWTALSGKRYSSSLLSKWLIKNATFLPNDGQPLRHLDEHLDASTHQVDFLLRFPDPKPEI
jgi:outer membrane protein assembly factor BamA